LLWGGGVLWVCFDGRISAEVKRRRFLDEKIDLDSTPIHPINKIANGGNRAKIFVVFVSR